MKRYLVLNNMKILESKKMRAGRALPRHNDSHRKAFRAIHGRSAYGTIETLSEILTDIDFNDDTIKRVLIDMAFNRFLKEKTPINVSFKRYLVNFYKFNVMSLLCACSYMESAKITSKGDVRTFIYMFLGFNLLSSKYLDDYCVWNSSYAALWGIDCIQATQIEVFALKRINYELNVHPNSIFKTISEALYILDS